MKKLIVLSLFGLFAAACGNQEKAPESSGPVSNAPETPSTESGNPSYDPHRGEGKFTDIKIEEKLDAAMADGGSKTFDVKCSSCHKLTDEKLVGPGWKGVTERRQAPWIMNFITNTDAMINKDPAAQAQLEICLVRMPNQSLSDEEARNLYEFMRNNDGVK
jgi:mono/diheme cytochrome c family protein